MNKLQPGVFTQGHLPYPFSVKQLCPGTLQQQHSCPCAKCRALNSAGRCCSGELGCPHYKRRCKLVAPCCDRIYTCRECHDEAEPDHDLDSKVVEQMVCMECNSRQPAAGERSLLCLLRKLTD